MIAVASISSSTSNGEPDGELAADRALVLALSCEGLAQNNRRLVRNRRDKSISALGVHPLVVVLGGKQSPVGVKPLADRKEVVRLSGAMAPIGKQPDDGIDLVVKSGASVVVSVGQPIYGQSTFQRRHLPGTNFSPSFRSLLLIRFPSQMRLMVFSAPRQAAVSALFAGVLLAASLALGANARASTLNAPAPVRVCTNLVNPGCRGWKTLAAKTSVTMRCWQDESVYDGTNRWFWVSGGGVQGFVSANQVSAQARTPSCLNDKAVQAARWAGSHLGQNYDAGECLKFVHDSWLDGAGLNIGWGETAWSYWNANPRRYARAYDTRPAVGALVFWKPDTYSPGEGHVALSLGSGWVISTEERSTVVVHVFAISARNQSKPYAGYLVP